MNTIKSLNSFHKRVIVNLILLLGAAGIIFFSCFYLFRMPGTEDVPPLASPQEFASHGIIIPETTYCLRYYNADGDRVTRFREYILFSESDILIDEEVKKMIAEQYERAKTILSEHKEGHAALAQLLIEREVIFAEDVERIFGKRPWASRSDEILDKVENLQAEKDDDETKTKELPEKSAADKEIKEEQSNE